MQELQFTIPEILSLLGFTQCVYILVYMMFGSGSKKSIILPSAYFFALCVAFALDFASRFLADGVAYYDLMQWGAWYIGPPLSVLLILQVAGVSSRPSRTSYWILLLIPAAFIGAYVASNSMHGCTFEDECDVFREWLAITGLMSGIVSVMEIWKRREVIETIYSKKTQGEQDRYWLILMLIAANLFFLGFMLVSLNAGIDDFHSTLLRTFMGLGLVYLTSTSLFRIYPQAVRIMSAQDKKMLSKDELSLIDAIVKLIEMDKVYQEVTYSRAEMARELKTSEATVSKLINFHFGKSLPQLLNEKRVEDAKRLLRQTDAPIKVIAENVGFNSMASFNRVFKDISGLSPSEYRDKN
jgi:AraC-like DNA-binding protein